MIGFSIPVPGVLELLIIGGIAFAVFSGVIVLVIAITRSRKQ